MDLPLVHLLHYLSIHPIYYFHLLPLLYYWIPWLSILNSTLFGIDKPMIIEDFVKELLNFKFVLPDCNDLSKSNAGVGFADIVDLSVLYSVVVIDYGVFVQIDLKLTVDFH